MRYNQGNMSAFLLGPDARRVTTLAAAVILAKARTYVGKDTGHTAATGRLVHGIGGAKNDRVKVTVAFDGAGVYQQFSRNGNRFLSRALRG